jgi:Endonuclease/Exonuclease/phosphatase family
VRFGGEARKRLGLLGVLVEQRGRLTWGGAECGSIACPSFIQEATQPQEGYQQEVMDREVVYHNVSFLLGEIDDRPLGSQAGDLSARWRYTTRRTAEAVTVREFLNREMEAAPATHTIVLGDFNDEPRAATSQILLRPPDRDATRADQHDPVRLYNVVDAIPLRAGTTQAFLAATERFTRLHEGGRELLDHVLISKGLLLRGNEFVVKEVRSFVDVIAGQTVTADPNERDTSVPPDHAPVWVRFEL